MAMTTSRMLRSPATRSIRCSISFIETLLREDRRFIVRLWQPLVKKPKTRVSDRGRPRCCTAQRGGDTGQVCILFCIAVQAARQTECALEHSRLCYSLSRLEERFANRAER